MGSQLGLNSVLVLLVGPMARPRGFLRSQGCHVGRFECHVGSVWDHFGSCWSRFGLFWGHLGCKIGAIPKPKGRQNGMLRAHVESQLAPNWTTLATSGVHFRASAAKLGQHGSRQAPRPPKAQFSLIFSDFWHIFASKMLFLLKIHQKKVLITSFQC